jgi:hypothetical protein
MPSICPISATTLRANCRCKRQVPSLANVKSVDIAIDSALVDLVSEGFDAGAALGEIVSTDMIAVPLGPRQRSACVASPAFLREHASPPGGNAEDRAGGAGDRDAPARRAEGAARSGGAQPLLYPRGEWHYLWRAVDQNGIVLDILVQRRRDAKGEAFLQAAVAGMTICAAGDRDRSAKKLRGGQASGSPRGRTSTKPISYEDAVCDGADGHA